jgi:hypothetical protein
MKHGQNTMETFMKTPVSQGLKQTVRSHTPPLHLIGKMIRLTKPMANKSQGVITV